MRQPTNLPNGYAGASPEQQAQTEALLAAKVILFVLGLSLGVAILVVGAAVLGFRW